MISDPVSSLMYVMRFILNPALFAIAGILLAFARPRWLGTWLLLVGAMLSLGVVALRLTGLPPRDASEYVWFAYEVAESLGFLLTGVGVLFVAWRARIQSAA